MAGPICEISPEEVPISNYAVRYTERRLPNGNYEPTCPPAAIGTAWEAEAGSLEHIWSDDMPFAKYQFAAVGIIKLASLPLDNGEIFVAVDKHFYIPDPTAFPVCVYTASAYVVEPPQVRKVRSDGWETPTEAIDALLADLQMKVELLGLDPTHFALDGGQITRPLRRTFVERFAYEARLKNLAPGTMDESNDVVSRTLDQFASLPAHQGYSAQDLLQLGNRLVLGSGGAGN